MELMRSIHAVSEYTGLNIREALELPCDMFLLCLKNHTIDRLMQSEAGREYLEDCERLNQTEMDKDGLKKMLGAMK